MPTSSSSTVAVRGRRARAKPAGRYHHGDLRAALLDEGKRLLERHGPAELSLRQLARRLGVSHNAPYKHFATREALLAALAAEGFRRLTERTAEGARLGGLHGAGLAYVGFALDDPAVFRLMFSDVLDKTAFADLRDAAARSFAALRSRVAAVWGEADADLAAVSAWSLVHGLANLLIAGQLPTVVGGGQAPLEIAERVLRAWGAPPDARRSA